VYEKEQAFCWLNVHAHRFLLEESFYAVYHPRSALRVSFLGGVGIVCEEMENGIRGMDTGEWGLVWNTSAQALEYAKRRMQVTRSMNKDEGVLLEMRTFAPEDDFGEQPYPGQIWSVVLATYTHSLNC